MARVALGQRQQVLHAGKPGPGLVGGAIGGGIGCLDAIEIGVLAPVAIQRPGLQPQVPARQARHVGDVQVQFGVEHGADAAGMAVEGVGGAQRQFQLEQARAALGLPEHEVEPRAEFRVGVQIGHARAGADLVAGGGRRQRGRHREFDPVRVEQLASHPVAIGLEEFTVVGEVGGGQHELAGLIRSPVGGEGHDRHAHARLPERLFLRGPCR